MRRIRIVIICLAVTGAVVGGLAGVAGYTFVYARGASYLTNDPASCANCHVMNDQYDSWIKSSHHGVAHCNDCHTPQALAPKYLTKASNGYHHSLAFTTGNFHQPIRIKETNLAVVEAACLNCHGPMVEGIENVDAGGEPLSCVRCHPGVGHME